MESTLFHPDLLTTHEPQRVGTPEDDEIVRMADRGSLSPRPSEARGVRVRGGRWPIQGKIASTRK